MKNKRIWLAVALSAVGIVAAPVAVFYGMLFLHDTKAYNQSKEAVERYMQGFDFAYEVTRIDRGKNAYPAERTEDCFYVHDIDNDIYFQIISYDSGGVITDRYDEYLCGAEILKDIQEQFPDKEFLGKLDAERYNPKYVTGPLVLFAEYSDDSVQQMYAVYKYIAETYVESGITYIIAPMEKKAVFEDLYSYRGNDLYRDSQGVYSMRVSSSSKYVADFERFSTGWALLQYK